MMKSTLDNALTNTFALRRSIAPYIAMPVIAILMLPVLIWGAVKSGDWRGIEIFYPGFAIINASIVWSSTRYRIWWKDGEIIQKAVAGNLTVIKVSDITRIVQETSDVRTLVTLSRPVRRLVIYGKDASGMKYIDVSLKHFVADDIRKLMAEIHDRRPDLIIPKT